MGKILLSVLNGYWRYAHINSVRANGFNPGLLGLRGTFSEDALRLAMYRIAEKAGLEWISTQILDSISPAYSAVGSAENGFPACQPRQNYYSAGEN